LVAPFLGLALLWLTHLGLALSNSFISTSLGQIPDGLAPADHRPQGPGE
jgi:hypothetical protein